MARPRKYGGIELATRAQQLLEKLPQGKLYFRLLAISKTGEHSAKRVAFFFNVGEHTICRWTKLFLRYGTEGLIDRPKGHYPRKLSEEQREQVHGWLSAQKNSRGESVHWTLDNLRAEIASEFGVSIGMTPLWKQIRKLGFIQKVPRPCHVKADKEMQDSFKKNCRNSKRD